MMLSAQRNDLVPVLGPIIEGAITSPDALSADLDRDGELKPVPAHEHDVVSDFVFGGLFDELRSDGFSTHWFSPLTQLTTRQLPSIVNLSYDNKGLAG